VTGAVEDGRKELTAVWDIHCHESVLQNLAMVIL
jgi:hypothetical protein